MEIFPIEVLRPEYLEFFSFNHKSAHTMKNTNKISTCLWFDPKVSGAEEAASFYTSIFENAKIVNTMPYIVETPSNKPVGSVMTVDFDIEGFFFTALNGGPYFKINPSISFILNFDPSMMENTGDKLE